MSAAGWGAAFRLARRESREGLKGFRVFALALVLGVAAIAAIGSLSAAFQEGLENEKRRLLGGDVEITAFNEELSAEALGFLEGSGRVSKIVSAQLMAHAEEGEARSVIQLKAVDDAYPLIGEIKLAPDTEDLAAALAPATGEDGAVRGAVADRTLLDRLGLSPGGRIRIGAATFIVKAAIDSEPDRAAEGFLLGPRIIVSRAGADATRLLETSALVNYSYRVALENEDAAAFEARLAQSFPANPWRVRSAAKASEGLARLLENLDVFLTLIGLAALVIGGVGAANAVRAYMERKTPVIATLKCLGASGDFILKTYMMQTLMVAGAAIAAGLAAGALAPFAVAGFFGAMLPFKAAPGLYPAALVEAAAFGLLAASAFAFWPLAAARRASAARLFRSLVEAERPRPARRDMLIIAALAALFLGLATALSGDRKFTLIFFASGMAVYAALRFIAWLAVYLARRYWRPKRPMARIAAANLTRPGASTASVTVSLGLGLTLLALVSLIDANLSRELTRALPQRAPALFFSDIAFEDAARFDARMKALAAGAEVERFFMMRAGVVLLNGRPLSAVEGAEDSPWAEDNDWGVTFLDEIPPEMGDIVAGEVWAKDYSGPPRLALSEWQAKRFKLNPGDNMTLAIGGREITAEVAALFDQNWDRDGLNFVAIFAPGTLEAARPTSIGSLRTGDLDLEADVARALAREFPGVTVIRTREVIETVSGIVASIGFVIRALSGLTIAAGLIVLLGAIAADFARKLKDAMIMKTIGAPRRRILAAHLIEYSVLGAGPAFAAAGLGLFGSWFVVARRMEIDWRPAPEIVAAVIFGAVAVTLLAGTIAAMRALAARPWPVLRSD
jgi:putative ABC transport system permease protein